MRANQSRRPRERSVSNLRRMVVNGWMEEGWMDGMIDLLIDGLINRLINGFICTHYCRGEVKSIGT